MFNTFNISVNYIQHFGHFWAHVLKEKECDGTGSLHMPSEVRLICICIVNSVLAVVGVEGPLPFCAFCSFMTWSYSTLWEDIKPFVLTNGFLCAIFFQVVLMKSQSNGRNDALWLAALNSCWNLCFGFGGEAEHICWEQVCLIYNTTQNGAVSVRAVKEVDSRVT